MCVHSPDRAVPSPFGSHIQLIIVDLSEASFTMLPKSRAFERRTFHQLLVGAIAMAISKNSSASHGTSNFEEPQGSGPTIELIAANNEFAIKFFREVDSSRPASNQFLSPFSIESALLMTMEGARHQTSSEMGAALLSYPIGSWCMHNQRCPKGGIP